MAKNEAAKAEEEAAKKEEAKNIPGKIFEKLTLEDLTAMKRGIDEIRCYANSSMSECIRVSSAFQAFHYTGRDGNNRDGDQDKRVREGAKQRGGDSVRNLKDYLLRLEEELRGIRKTL